MLIITITVATTTIIITNTTQVNSTFLACWLASSEVISQLLFTSEQPNKNKMAFVSILSQIKLLFGPQVIQRVWYIVYKTILFTSVSVKVVDIWQPWIIVNNNNNDNNNNSCSRTSSSTRLQIVIFLYKRNKKNYAWLRLHFGWTITKQKFVGEHMLNFIFDSLQYICLSQRKKLARRNVWLELGFFLSDMGKSGLAIVRWPTAIYSPAVVVVAAAAAPAAVKTTIFTQEAPLTELVFREVQKLKVWWPVLAKELRGWFPALSLVSCPGDSHGCGKFVWGFAADCRLVLYTQLADKSRQD